MIGSRKIAMGGAAGALAAAFAIAAAQSAAAQAYPLPIAYGAPYAAPYFGPYPGFGPGPYGMGMRPLVIRSAAYGAEYRWPYRPDLVVRVGPPDDRCTVSYEQTMSADGLVWRPLMDCNRRY